ncbi:hypothetical protein O181_037263 [Austropuccinia psidii MF-1]|uniref:Integrase zinc-binding domain-containing protein n=1 Tax=Austropuccinia psidii MF-1 TaxID=1389203 RepID=A0A9Q3DB29_9BASI|nr:hypothetical protein [Austropuccinia psidii MF-1]
MPDGIQESRYFSIKAGMFIDVVEKIQKEVWYNKEYNGILKQLERGESISDSSLEHKANLSLLKDRVVIPRNPEIQLDIIPRCHDSLLADPPGQEETLKHIKKNLYWAGMNQFNKY